MIDKKYIAQTFISKENFQAKSAAIRNSLTEGSKDTFYLLQDHARLLFGSRKTHPSQLLYLSMFLINCLTFAPLKQTVDLWESLLNKEMRYFLFFKQQPKQLFVDFGLEENDRKKMGLGLLKLLSEVVVVLSEMVGQGFKVILEQMQKQKALIDIKEFNYFKPSLQDQFRHRRKQKLVQANKIVNEENAVELAIKRLFEGGGEGLTNEQFQERTNQLLEDYIKQPFKHQFLNFAKAESQRILQMRKSAAEASRKEDKDIALRLNELGKSWKKVEASNFSDILEFQPLKKKDQRRSSNLMSLAAHSSRPSDRESQRESQRAAENDIEESQAQLELQRLDRQFKDLQIEQRLLLRREQELQQQLKYQESLTKKEEFSSSSESQEEGEGSSANYFQQKLSQQRLLLHEAERLVLPSSFQCLYYDISTVQNFEFLRYRALHVYQDSSLRINFLPKERRESNLQFELHLLSLSTQKTELKITAGVQSNIHLPRGLVVTELGPQQVGLMKCLFSPKVVPFKLPKLRVELLSWRKSLQVTLPIHFIGLMDHHRVEPAVLEMHFRRSPSRVVSTGWIKHSLQESDMRRQLSFLLPMGSWGRGVITGLTFREQIFLLAVEIDQGRVQGRLLALEERSTKIGLFILEDLIFMMRLCL